MAYNLTAKWGWPLISAEFCLSNCMDEQNEGNSAIVSAVDRPTRLSSSLKFVVVMAVFVDLVTDSYVVFNLDI